MEVAVSDDLPVDAIIGRLLPGFLELCSQIQEVDRPAVSILLSTRTNYAGLEAVTQASSINLPESDVFKIMIESENR